MIWCALDYQNVKEHWYLRATSSCAHRRPSRAHRRDMGGRTCRPSVAPSAADRTEERQVPRASRYRKPQGVARAAPPSPLKAPGPPRQYPQGLSPRAPGLADNSESRSGAAIAVGKTGLLQMMCKAVVLEICGQHGGEFHKLAGLSGERRFRGLGTIQPGCPRVHVDVGIRFVIVVTENAWIGLEGRLWTGGGVMPLRVIARWGRDSCHVPQLPRVRGWIWRILVAARPLGGAGK